MKKSVFMKKMAIVAILLVLTGLLGLAEVGIANLFGIQYNGMPYNDYAKQFFETYPWALWCEGAAIIGVIVLWTHFEYQEIESLIIKIKEKKFTK